MLRRLIAISVCIVYLSGSCVSFIPYISYALNKGYIAQNLCENKDKPRMHCNGKCYIGKEIIKLNEQKENTKDDQQQVQQNEIFPHENISFFTLPYFEQVVSLSDSYTLNQLQSQYICNLDLPPEFLS